MSEKTIIFYSGKLWYSDKPFPEKCHECDNIAVKVYALCEGCQIEFNQAVRNWLSTAYEVVNPEVVTDRPQRQWLVDGDQVTLPEGYGIKSNEVPCVADPNTGQCNSDCKCGFMYATITLPEKTENSAHGECKECTAYFGYPMSKCFHCKHKVSEPSESQEDSLETWIEKERNVLQNVGSLMWTDPEGKEKALLVARSMTTTLEYIREARKKGMIK